MKIVKIPSYMIILLFFGLSSSNAQLLRDNNLKNSSNKSLEDASRIGRTSGAKSPAFQELYDYEEKEISLVESIFPYQKLIHRAYVIMLME